MTGYRTRTRTGPVELAGQAPPPGPREPARSIIDGVPLWLLPAGVAMLVGLIGMNSRQLWNDEHATWWTTTLSWTELARLLRNIDAVLAPYYLLLRPWTAVFGTSEIALRMPSLLATAAAAGCLALLGRRLHSAAAGLLAGLLFAVVPGITQYALEARPYAFAVLGAVLATLFLVRALDAPAPLRWAAYALALVLVGWAHLVSLFILVPHAAFVVARCWPQRRLIGWWLAAAVLGTIPSVPLAYLGQRQAGQIGWIEDPDWKSLLDLPGSLLGAPLVAGIVVGLAILTLASGALASGALASGRPASGTSTSAALGTRSVGLTGQRLLLGGWALLPPLLVWALHPLIGLYYPRYLLFTVPAWLLLASIAAVSVGGAAPGAGQRTARLAAGPALAVLLAVTLAGFPEQQALRSPTRTIWPDFRGAAQVIEAGAVPGDGIVFVGPRRPRRGMAYEMRDLPVPVRDVFLDRTPQQRGAFLGSECADPEPCLGATRRLWLVTTESIDDDVFEGLSPAIEELLRANFEVTERTPLRRVTVVLLDRS